MRGARRGAARADTAPDRSTSGCSSTTFPSTCSCSAARRWRARPSSASTRPAAARSSRTTSATPTARSWSPKPRTGRCSTGLELGFGRDRIVDIESPTWQEWIDARRLTRRSPPSCRRPETLFVLIFTSGSTGAPKAVRGTQGRFASIGGRMPFGPDDVLYCPMPLFHGNALASNFVPALTSGATIALRRRSSPPRSSSPTCGPSTRRTSTRSAARSRTCSRHPRPTTTATTASSSHSRRNRRRADAHAFRDRFGIPLVGGYGSSEGAIIISPVRDARPGALGRPAAGDVAVVDPVTGEECPPAELDEHGRLTNAAARDRRDRAARSRPRVRGLLRQRRGDGRAQPQRLVLVGRPRLPRRRRHLLLRGPIRRLDPRRRRELRGRAGRAHHRPASRRRRGRRVRRSRPGHRRPGDGRAGAAGRAGVRRRRSSPPSSTSNAISVRSGRPGSCASSTRSRLSAPTRSTRRRCAPSAWTAPPGTVWWRPRPRPRVRSIRPPPMRPRSRPSSPRTGGPICCRAPVCETDEPT